MIQTEPVHNPNVTESDELKAVKPQTMPYVSSTWYHPMNLENLGRIGETEGALKRDWFLTRNYEGFLLQNNPFEVGQCTWYACQDFIRSMDLTVEHVEAGNITLRKLSMHIRTNSH